MACGSHYDHLDIDHEKRQAFFCFNLHGYTLRRSP